MRSWKHGFLATAFALSALVPAGQALAADSDPSIPTSLPLSTSAEHCDVDPVNFARLFEIAGSAMHDPNAVIGTESIDLSNATVVTGDDAEAVVALAEEFVACVNAGDQARAYALLSDDFIRNAAYEVLGEIDASAPPTPSPSDPADETRVVAATGVFELPDGRFSYTMDMAGTSDFAQPYARIQLIVVEQAGEYKIDDFRLTDIESEVTDCGINNDSDGCRAPDAATPVEGDGYSGWLMTTAQATEAILWFGIDDSKYSAFNVNADQVAEAEAKLAAYVDDQPRATQRLIDGLDSGMYERQYFGYAYEFESLIVINGYCPGEYFDPAQFAVVVMDGGDCYWQATYNLTSGRFIDFSVNGDA